MSSQRHPSRRMIARWREREAMSPNDPESSVVERFRVWYIARRAKNNAAALRHQAKKKAQEL